MTLLKEYKVFITHGYANHSDYDRLAEMLLGIPSLNIIMISAPESIKYRSMNKEKREEEIRKQIRPANCIFALDSIYIENSEWVQYELKCAASTKKPIIGIRQLRSKIISKPIENVAVEILGWNEDEITRAIKEYSIRPMLIN